MLIRADGGQRVGSGHVMRCLALSQALRAAGWEVRMVLADRDPGIDRRLQAEEVEASYLFVESGSSEDADRTCRTARDWGAAWVTLDGYEFGTLYQRRIGESGAAVLVIDEDARAGRFHADVILNHNLHASEAMYRGRQDDNSTLLLGPAYALLREEFAAHAAVDRAVPEIATRVLVTMGGSDATNVTETVIEGLRLADVPGLEVVVVVGVSNANLPSLQRAAAAVPFPLRLESGVQHMRPLMEWCHLAVVAAGTTTWELAYLGVPMITMATADNQRPIASSLQMAGAARSLGWSKDVTPVHIGQAVTSLCGDEAEREAMTRRGRKLVDGRGAARVSGAIAGRKGT